MFTGPGQSRTCSRKECRGAPNSSSALSDIADNRELAYSCSQVSSLSAASILCPAKSLQSDHIQSPAYPLDRIDALDSHSTAQVSSSNLLRFCPAKLQHCNDIQKLSFQQLYTCRKMENRSGRLSQWKSHRPEHGSLTKDLSPNVLKRPPPCEALEESAYNCYCYLSVRHRHRVASCQYFRKHL